MLERYLHALSLADGGSEDIAATRERLKERFPRGATRRMTQLGMFIGVALDDLGPRDGDAVVYASAYGESCALEAYLDSFPTPSPTLFQTSIHPSAVQQALIGRQHPVGEFLPCTGRRHLVAHALQAAVLSPAPRVLFCGGEERGTWLLERGIASDRTFALALELRTDPEGAQGRLAIAPAPETAPVEMLPLPEFFAALRGRQSIDQIAAPGLRLSLTWL